MRRKLNNKSRSRQRSGGIVMGKLRKGDCCLLYFFGERDGRAKARTIAKKLGKCDVHEEL